MKKESNLYNIKGNFDLPLTHACTMSCDGCSYLDYKDMGNTICNIMRFDEVKYIAESIMDMDITLNNLTFLGGEPTIHPEYKEIAEWLSQYKGILYNNLNLHTNGTNFNKKFLESIEFFDILKVSLYPLNREVKQEMLDSGMDEYIRDKGVSIWYKEIDEFLDYGTERDDLEYSQKLNWDRCTQKWTCRVLTKEGGYRCYVMYNHRKGYCDYTDRDKFIHYFEQDKDPMKACKGCPFPPKTKKWKSDRPDRDKKSINHGLKKIREFKNNL